MNSRDNRGSIKSPHHAWLAPIAGIGAAFLIRVFAPPENSVSVESNAKLIQALPGLAFIVCIVFGIFKSIQCLVGKRALWHGFGGLLVNGIAAFSIVAMLMTAVMAIREMDNPAADVSYVVSQMNKEIPFSIDENTKIVRVFAGPPTMLNVEMEVHGFDLDEIDISLFAEQLENETRKNAHSSSLGVLLENGANIRYIYRHSDGQHITEFTLEALFDDSVAKPIGE